MTSIPFALASAGLLAPHAAAQQPLSPPELTTGVLAGFNGAKFGLALEIDGDAALITAPVTFFGSSLSGAAWIYRFDGASWVVEQALDSPGGNAYQDFGTSAALSGDVAIVSSRYMDTVAGNNSGGAVVFERVGGTWVIADELVPPAGSVEALYGTGVALDGDLAVLHSDSVIRPFLVYERQPSGAWALVDEVVVAAGFDAGLAGARARVQGETLFLPTPQSSLVGSSEGAIQVWTRGATPLLGGFGALDAEGTATAHVVIPAGLSPSLAGATVHHAYVVLDAATFAVRAASEAEALTLAP